MFKAKFVSPLFWELGDVQFWIASFSLPTLKQKKDGIHPAASQALRQEVGKKHRERIAFVKLLGCIIYFAKKKINISTSYLKTF